MCTTDAQVKLLLIRFFRFFKNILNIISLLLKEKNNINHAITLQHPDVRGCPVYSSHTSIHTPLPCLHLEQKKWHIVWGFWWRQNRRSLRALCTALSQSVFFFIQKHTYLPPPECVPSVFDDDVFYSHTAPLEESVAACALVSCGIDVDDWLQGLKRLRPTLHGFIQVYPFIL